MDDHRAKFQQLLRELFQFDCADLDFGIYRIMNHKRDVIERFITQDLPKAITEELDSGALADQIQAAEELKEVARQIKETLGKDALDADGNIAKPYGETPLGRKYLDLKARAAGGRGREALEAGIFNHLFSFFSRYYQDGDFISKRRYSRRQKYAIPYNGEEVYLYWANNDQYYVKTAEYFHDYIFSSRGVTVHFKLLAASVEQNNVKGDKRFFRPCAKETEWDEGTGRLIIPFEYRPLTEQEEIAYGKKNQQETIIAEGLAEIPKRLKKADRALAAVTAERHKNSEGRPVTFLEHHLRQYTRRNTSDFFIHKDLKGFLSRELDFYLKNEVLNLDEMESAGEDRAEGWFQITRAIKVVGGRIIDFLDQIERFQKMLWEKRKFITETQYCITVVNIGEGFYADIAACEAQWAEWKELFHIDEEQTDLFTSGKSKKDKRIAFLKAHPTLVLDTKHFQQNFVDRLLGGFDDLDELTNGLLVHGDNFQALTLLLHKHAGGVRCMYIDPPFNTGADEFIYKDGYSHSSWLAMMESRVRIAQRLLTEDGTFYAHIDYTEKERLKLLFDKYLSYITEIIWRIGWVSGYKSAAEKFIRNHDTIYQYGKTDSPLFIKTYIPYPEGYTRRDGSPPSGEGYPLEDTWNCSDMDQLHSIQIMSFSKEKVGNQALTQKNENLVARMLSSSSRAGDMVLDYFLGSGTTSAVAHKMDRRYLGIEMGEQFFSFALPRMKRVLHGDPYGISSDAGWKGGGMFKYIRLESYEDALNNIEFDDASGQQAMKFDDYLLKYMLNWETRASETLLNVEKLARPFSYKLHIHADGQTREKVVDIPETFNYLLGLHVRTRRVHDDYGRRYLVYTGRVGHRQVVVIWRETEGWQKADLERDKKFVAEQKLTEGADELFVNGDSFIPKAKALEPVFKARMFAGVES